MSDADGAWIFLSHSTKDWNEVRRVRNLLEEKGHRPLVFFLKCLTEHSELDDLIKREIEARSWFLLCNSKNAQESSWVQAEVAYIKELQDKYHEEIDLNDAIEAQIERIDRLCKRATVFLSYSRQDVIDARRIQGALINRDYSVWIDTALTPGSDWKQELESAIDRAIERGFVMVLLSRKTAQSQWTIHEIDYAFDRASKAVHGANVVPIMLQDPGATLSAMPPTVQQFLTSIQWFDFSQGDFETNIAKLISNLRKRAMD